MIYGKRIRLRAIDHQDLSTFLKYVNDPEVSQGVGLYLPFSMADEEGWFETMRAHPPYEHSLAIEVRLPGEHAGEPPVEMGDDCWKLIGSCGFFNFDPRNRSAEFGIMIGDKSYWNQGYGTETVRLLAQHGFHTLNLNRIFLRVFEDNARAIKVYEKAGFVHEVRHRQAEFRNGKYKDMLVMSLLRDEHR